MATVSCSGAEGSSTCLLREMENIRMLGSLSSMSLEKRVACSMAWVGGVRWLFFGIGDEGVRSGLRYLVHASGLGREGDGSVDSCY